MGTAKKGFRVVEGAKSSRRPNVPGENGDDWEEALIRDGRGLVVNNLANLARILRSAPEWAGALRFNENTQDIEILNAPCLPGPFPRAWREGDQQATAIWLQTVWRLNAAPGRVLDAALVVARERSYNPIKEHLEALPPWDGVRRLETWLSRYFSVEDSLYTRSVGACWLRSVVARGLTPGAKADAMLVLEGLQGKGKSTAFEILGGPFFIEVHTLVGERAVHNIAGKLIVELSELEALNRAEANAVKASISCRVDRMRLPYDRRPVDIPRTAVLCGTCNKNDYLRDETGNRRFWPVAVPKGQTIDLEALRADRDQLLAEAMAGVLAGDPWHLISEEVRAEAAEQAEDRRQVDVWEERVLPYLRDKEPSLRRAAPGPGRGIPLGEVLEFGVGLKPEAWGVAEQTRVSRILRSLGWERKNDRLPGQIDPATGKQKREWRWHPPDLLPPEPPPGTSTSGADDEGGTTMPQPEKAFGTSGTSGSTQNGVAAKQRAASGGELSGLPSSTGTTGTTGTKREKQGVQERFQSGQVAQDAGTAGTKAYREARRAGYSHTEAASIAQAEGEGVPDV
jgi:putative DNA primase/helicase